MQYDVLIIGAGVIGSMAAREFSKYDLSVCVLEKENDVAMGASKANSGIIHGGYDPEPNTLKAKMNSHGIKLLYETARELGVEHKNNGSMVCAFGEDEEAEIDRLFKRGLENGIEGLRIVSGDDARRLEPALSYRISKVLLVENAGIICPYKLTVAAIGNAMDNGVNLIRNFEVSEIKKRKGIFTVKSTNGEAVKANLIINCAGCYSDKVAQMAGDCGFKIIPRAGEYMLLDKTEGGTVSRTVFQVPTPAGKGVLVTPTADGNLLIGPTAQLVSSPEDNSTTQKGIDTVVTLAKKSVPSIDFSKVITSFSGVRSSEEGGDFIIKASEKIDNFINVAAIDSPGLTSCVAIARYVIDIAKELGIKLAEKPNWCGKRKASDFFNKMTDSQKDEYIKENNAYGKIVCRCEGITEGEIRDAVRRNPAALDMDGVKRRTRSGMGRCQGGFCSPFVMRIIAEETGVQIEDVTKNGGKSNMVIGRM